MSNNTPTPHFAGPASALRHQPIADRDQSLRRSARAWDGWLAGLLRAGSRSGRRTTAGTGQAATRNPKQPARGRLK